MPNNRPLDLEASTRIYWEISKAYNGRGGQITVVRAFEDIQKALNNLNPERRVAFMLNTLRNEIVYNNAGDEAHEQAETKNG